MAKPQFFQLYDLNDVPLTSASPSFVVFKDRAGTTRTSPGVPTHVGSGLYTFTPTDADENAGSVALIDGGASAYPRYTCAVIHRPDNSNQFWAFHVEDAAGALWTGAAPTLGAYRSPGGTAIVPTPAITAIAGAYLYVAIPSPTDMTNGAAIWVSYPSTANTVGYSGFTNGVGTSVNSAFTISGTTPTSHYLDITFTDSVAALNFSAADFMNYTFVNNTGTVGITALQVLINSPTVLRVYHTKPHNGDLYVLTMPVNGLKSVANVYYNDTPTISFTAVAASPVLAEADFVDVRDTRVIFSEPVMSPEALNPANYSFSPVVAVYSVIKENDAQYLLKTAQQNMTTTYTVTASNIKDASNNIV
jgi:hypothetical protein